MPRRGCRSRASVRPRTRLLAAVASGAVRPRRDPTHRRWDPKTAAMAKSPLMRAQLLTIAVAACAPRADPTSVRSEVQAYTQLVAKDVTRDGPTAWKHHLAD